MEKDNIKSIDQSFAKVFGKEPLILNEQNFIFDDHKAILFSNDLTIRNALEIAFSLIGRAIVEASDQNLYENLETFKDILSNDLKCTFEQAEGHIALQKECSLNDLLYEYKK